MKTMKFLLVFLCTAVCMAEEFVKNGDFEKDLAPWTCAQRRGGKHDLHTLSNETQFGKACLRVTGDPENQYNSFIALVQPLPVLDKKTVYLFQVKVRSSIEDATGKEFKVAIRQANADDAGLGYTGFTINLAESSWRNYDMRFSPDKRAASYALYIFGRNLSSEDTVFVDDVSFSPLVETTPPFDPAKTCDLPGSVLENQGFSAKINEQTGLLSSLNIHDVLIHPEAEHCVMVFVRQGQEEFLLDGKNTTSTNGQFRAKAEYSFNDGFFRERIIIEALVDIDAPVKIGVRHGFDMTKWNKIVNALRPIRVIPATQATTFSYGENRNDLNFGDLDQYQHVAYPMVILENDSHFLLTASRNLDDFVTLSPNVAKGFLPSIQQNPKTIRKGDRFHFENNWKLFAKAENRLRDLWRYYSDHLQTSNPELQAWIPPRYSEERCFYPGAFGSHTYFLKEREERLRPGSNTWFYSWHDNIKERYPVAGEWWSAGNNWKKKLSASEIKNYLDYLQKEKNLNAILYLRQLANLHLRGKEFPEEWYKRTPGGALHLYGGGYKVKLPEHVAADVGYDDIPLGQFDFSNPEYRAFYHEEIFQAIRYYRPRAIGWDMGSDLNEFISIAQTYDRIRKENLAVKVVANESAGPTQPYSDMILLENGLLGGKSAYDFEVARAYTTAIVCLERFNLFALAVDANLDGKQTWLAAHGLAENKRYLDHLIKRNPEYAGMRKKLAQLCQLRASLYDLGMGASPGYLEEAQPVPEYLLQMAADVNGLLKVNRSFALRLPNGLETDGNLSSSAWLNQSSLRLVLYNDASNKVSAKLRMDREYFRLKGWNAEQIKNGKMFLVTPENETETSAELLLMADEMILQVQLPEFSGLFIFADK